MVTLVIKVNQKKVANNNFSNKGIDTIRVHVTFEDFFKKTEELQYGSHFTSASRFFWKKRSLRKCRSILEKKRKKKSKFSWPSSSRRLVLTTKLYIPSPIKTQCFFFFLVFWADWAQSTENFCNFAKVSYFVMSAQKVIKTFGFELYSLCQNRLNRWNQLSCQRIYSICMFLGYITLYSARVFLMKMVRKIYFFSFFSSQELSGIF